MQSTDELLPYLRRYVKRGVSVLEIGCGIGLVLRELLRLGAKCYGIDASPESIKAAAEILGEKEKSAITLKVADIGKLPFKDGSFDVVLSFEVLEHLTDKDLDSSLREIARVLKPGGKFISTNPYKEDLEKCKVMCPDCHGVFHYIQHIHSFSPSFSAGITTAILPFIGCTS